MEGTCMAGQYSGFIIGILTTIVIYLTIKSVKYYIEMKIEEKLKKVK